MTDLIFRGLQDGSPDLFFGREGPPDGADAHIAIAAQLPAITASASAAVAYGAQINAVLLAPTGAVSVQYRSEVSRPTVGAAADSIQQAVPRTGRAADSATLAQGLALPHRACWQQAAGRTSRVQGMWQGARRRLSVTDARFAQAVPSAAALQSAYQDAYATRRPLGGVFQAAFGGQRPLAGSFQEAFRTRRRTGTFRFQGSRPETAELAIFAHVGMSAKSGIRTQFQEAMPPRRGIRVPVVVPPVGGYVPPQGDAVHLLFKALSMGSFDLLFSDGRARPVGPQQVYIRSTYIVINDVTLVRLPENTILPDVYSISLSWDCDSWSVGWDASLPASALDAVMPESVGAPVELLATINGTSMHLLAENISRDRRFGDSRIKVSGRGRVAWLASPYADTVSRSNGSAMTAQQLAADALSINGVSIGWDLDWQIADWLVPTGAWSHQGAAIDAVKRIAESVGGYVVGHRNAQTLHVRPRYPSMPWSWGTATPDIVLPADIARAESIAWTNKPAYNRAFVSGQQLGVLGIGTRSGTAGDLPAPLITDALITHLDAARARAGSLLADTGPQATINLELPVLPETGILDLGALIEYNDGATARRGLVRAVRVAVAYPQVWQNVEIETHG